MDEYKKQDIIMQDLISPNFLEVSKMEMETFIANNWRKDESSYN